MIPDAIRSTVRIKTVLRLLLFIAPAAFPLLAAPGGISQSFTGNLINDADTGVLTFTLTQSAPVTIQTYSYAGGTNAAGAVIPAGGFDPTISLYDSAGNFLVGNRDGGCGNVSADAVTHFCWDAFLNPTLPAGVYTVVVTQSENLPNGPTLSSSFVYAGQPNFTTPPGGASSQFWDLFPGQRTSAWALDVVSSALLVPVAPIQEPVIAPLSITNSGSLGGFIPGAKISGTFVATGGALPYAWSSTGLPAGLSINSTTGAYSGTGGNPGVYSFNLQVADAESPVVTATQSMTYSVLGITTLALPNGSTTAAYSASLAATGGTGPYTFSASGLPSGLSISSGGVISGTPKSAGSFTVSIQVTSGGLTTSSAFTMAVTGPATLPLTVSSTTLLSGTVSTPYPSAGLQAAGGAPPYSWSVFGGVLPVGTSLSASGNLQGTPTLPGNYGFTAQVIDSNGAKATGVIAVTISPAPVTLSLGAFPNGVVGVSYPLQILTPLANGGQAPYAMAITSGNLPGGLTLSGQEISGTPTVPGTFPFTITVTDAAGKTVSGNGSIAVIPAQTTLLLSQSAVSFALTAGASGVPTPASVTVRSSAISTLLNYSFAVSPAASWLNVSGGNTTPGSLTIALNPTAPSLAASATPYSTVIAVTCVAPSPCAGLVQSIGVSLTVSAPPPQLQLSSSLLSFTAFSGNPASSSQSLGLQNTGGGTIDITSITTGAAWLTVSGTPTTLTAGPGTAITVTVNPSGLSPGYFTTTLTVNSSAGIESIPVTLLVTQTLIMSLDPGGAQFSAPAGSSPGIPGGSFAVSAVGTGTLNWSATLDPGPNWLTLNTGSGSSTAATAGAVNYSLNASVIAALAPANYYATITVSAPGVVNGVEEFEVVLNVTPATSAVNPVLSAAGLVFTSSAAATTGPQNILVYSGSAAASTPYQASAFTTDGAPWLVVTPATGSATLAAPGNSRVSVNVSGLAPGVYSGGVDYAFSGDAVRTVDVTLLVLKTGTVASARNTPEASNTACTPTRLIGTQTALYGNFAQAAGWPTPLSVNLMDDCGAAVNGATMTTTFSNGDPPMALSPRDSVSGIYVGTWTPRNPAPQVTVVSTAKNPPLPQAVAQVTGQVRTNGVPILTPNGTLDVFNPVVGAALVPGEAVQIYGSNLATATVIAPVPLPTSLGGTTILIGGIAAPLYYVSAGQIDAQIPVQLTPGNQYQMLVLVNGSYSTPIPIQIASVTPAVANINGQVIAQHAADYSLVTPAAPAQPGEYVVLYLSGLGATTNPVAAGAVTPADPSTLSVPVVLPTMTLNGVNVPVAFAGLTPYAVGLYQINFQVPADAPSGNLTLLVSQGGAVSNAVIVPVQ